MTATTLNLMQSRNRIIQAVRAEKPTGDHGVTPYLRNQFLYTSAGLCESTGDCGEGRYYYAVHCVSKRGQFDMYGNNADVLVLVLSEYEYEEEEIADGTPVQSVRRVEQGFPAVDCRQSDHAPTNRSPRWVLEQFEADLNAGVFDRWLRRD